MARLPNPERLHLIQQTVFAGLDRRPGAPDGSIIEESNLCGDAYPYLTVRPLRRTLRRLPLDRDEKPLDMLDWGEGENEILFTAATGHLYGNDDINIKLAPAEQRTLVGIGDLVILMPDALYYNVVTKEQGQLGAKATGTGATFADGQLGAVAAKANTLTLKGATGLDGLREGDTITVSGCIKEPKNNKAATIREIKGGALIFDEGTWTIPGEATSYEETAAITLERKIPTLTDGIIFEHENRLWAAQDKTIYACALGDPFNWETFDTRETDAWQLDTGSKGYFTAGCSYAGCPMFFKEESLLTIYGKTPSTFRTLERVGKGVKRGSSHSPAVAGETLFYLSTCGIMSYAGGLPRPVGEVLGAPKAHERVVGGSDGYRYYAAFQGDVGPTAVMHQAVFDTRIGCWHRGETARYVAYTMRRGNLYRCDSEGQIQLVGDLTDAEEGKLEQGASVMWNFTLGPYQDGSPGQKVSVQLLARLWLEEGSAAQAYIRTQWQRDDSGWKKVNAEMNKPGLHDYELPMTPQRSGMYWISFRGNGPAIFYDITRKIEYGSTRP